MDLNKNCYFSMLSFESYNYFHHIGQEWISTRIVISSVLSYENYNYFHHIGQIFISTRIVISSVLSFESYNYFYHIGQVWTNFSGNEVENATSHVKFKVIKVSFKLE